MSYALRLVAVVVFLVTLAAFTDPKSITIVDKTPALDVAPPAVAVGGTVELRWKALIAPTKGDWIGLFPTAAGEEATPLWRQETGGALEGRVTVAMPKAAGSYQFRYLSGGRVSAGGRSHGIPVVQCRPSGPATRIRHLVIIVPENHSFDSYYGRYCTAPPGSNPKCTKGPSCCEAAPAKDPGTGTPALLLTDKEHADYDPPHSRACMLDMQNNRQMDRYVKGDCGSPRNIAYADATTVGPYWKLAGEYAMGDRVFHPSAGASSQNNMYFSGGKFLFTDNEEYPLAKVAHCDGKQLVRYTQASVGDLLTACGVPWTYYPEGYADAAAAHPRCLGSYPHFYDPSDVPFQYYRTSADNPAVIRDYKEFQKELAEGRLPAVSYIKPMGIRTEHPGGGITISDGVAFTTGIVKAVLDSRYAASTLVLVTPDEGGGYFDHVPPPPDSPVDGVAYGNRIYMLALGRFAKKGGHVSHVTMEHSSLIRFIEWNWLDGEPGQLGTRDATVNNIGSLLDPVETGAKVPE